MKDSLFRNFYKNQNGTVKLLIVSVPLTVFLFFVTTTFKNKYKEQVLKGKHKIIVGKYDGIFMDAQSNKLLKYKYVVKGTTYRRSIYNISWYGKCNDDDSLCDSLKFLVMYLVEDPDKSLVCTIPFEGIEYLSDSMKFQEIEEFEWYDDTTILKCFE